MQHEQRKSIKHQGKNIKHKRKSIKHKIQHTVAQWYSGEGVERVVVVIRRKAKTNRQKFKKGGGKLGFVS